ncbi:hypothetical protein BpHYR1_036179, partial [Brachionus plicatilis]
LPVATFICELVTLTQVQFTEKTKIANENILVEFYVTICQITSFAERIQKRREQIFGQMCQHVKTNCSIFNHVCYVAQASFLKLKKKVYILTSNRQSNSASSLTFGSFFKLRAKLNTGLISSDSLI